MLVHDLHLIGNKLLAARTEPDQDRETEILARLSGSDQRVRQTALGLIDLYLRDRGR